MAILNLKIDRNGNLINIENNEILLGRSSLFDDGQWETQEDGIICTANSTVTKSVNPYLVADFDTYDVIKYYFSVNAPATTDATKSVLWCTDVTSSNVDSSVMFYSPAKFTKYYLWINMTKDFEFSEGRFYGCMYYKKLSHTDVECTLILLDSTGSEIYSRTIESLYFNRKFYFSTGVDSYYTGGAHSYVKDTKFYEDISPILAVVPLGTTTVKYLDLQGVSWFWARIKNLVETNGSSGSIDLSDYYTKTEVEELVNKNTEVSPMTEEDINEVMQ